MNMLVLLFGRLVFSSEDRFKDFLTSLVEISKALSMDGFIENCCLERATGRLVTGFIGRVEMEFMGKLVVYIKGELVLFMGRLLWIKGLLLMFRDVFLGLKLGACLGLVFLKLKFVS